MAIVRWTYSSYKTFKTCQRQYLHRYILKDVKFVQTEAGRYGDMVHKAIEDYFGQGAPLPDALARFKPVVDVAAGWPGDKHCELKLALGFDLQPCDYYDENYFVRGKADFVCIHGTKARVLDWKTGKSASYADVKQNELMALMLFKHYPQLEEATTGLVFFVPDRIVAAIYLKKDSKALWRRWLYEVSVIESAMDRDRFDPSPGGLCKEYCDVLSCEHNGKNR
jgi:hypothetical protein